MHSMNAVNHILSSSKPEHTADRSGHTAGRQAGVGQTWMQKKLFSHEEGFLRFFPDMRSIKRVYRNKNPSVNWSAAKRKSASRIANKPQRNPG